MSVKKTVLIVISVAVLLALVIAGILFFSKTYYVREARIEGFVFVDKRFDQNALPHVKSAASIIKPVVNYLGEKQFIDSVLDGYADETPAINACIQIADGKNVYRTDALGFFRIAAPWRKISKKPVAFSVAGRDIQFSLDMKNALSRYLFIRISEQGIPEILCIRETEGERQGNTHPVVLIHGFGLDIGAFRPTADLKGWEKACNLFRQDPDFKDTHSFYILNHWDDESFAASSLNLACFLRILKHVHGEETGIILLTHSAGSLIARHYTVSKYFKPGTVERFMMLAPPNKGSQAALLHVDDGDNSDGDGSAAKELLPDSRFLNCLNNIPQKGSKCETEFMINPYLQNRQGINPDIPCVIVAGDVRDVVIDKTYEGVSLVKKMAQETWDWVNILIQGEGGSQSNMAGKDRADDSGLSDEEAVKDYADKNNIPRGDLLVSLESQLIEDVPYIILPYPHGFMQRPESFEDERYRVMKSFILTGRLEERIGD